MKKILIIMVCMCALLIVGCRATFRRKIKPQPYPVPIMEAQWIRDGEPIEFEGEEWCPVDTVENLLDVEVYVVGEYRDVQFFVERIDVRPYARLYTKFGKNKFRAFKKKQHD